MPRHNLQNLYHKVSSGEGLRPGDMPTLLDVLLNEPWETIFQAGKLRELFFRDRVDPCSIINARSGNCPEDCAFCAQSAHHNADAAVYPLLPVERILKSARKAYEKGVRRFCIVTSGRGIDSGIELDSIAGCVEKIKAIGISPCATLGALDERQLKALKSAGLHRYHHNIETSRNFFPRICSTHGYDERIETLRAARSAGLSLCSGGIIGMGETMADRAEMALALKELDVDSVPLNFLMPIPGTPLAGVRAITPLEALKTIALFRFVLPGKEIRICGGRMTGLRDLHPMVFMAGANGVLMGDYLTTRGRGYDEDLAMLRDLGLNLSDG
jgi:biotin synthase